VNPRQAANVVPGEKEGWGLLWYALGIVKAHSLTFFVVDCESGATLAQPVSIAKEPKKSYPVQPHRKTAKDSRLPGDHLEGERASCGPGNVLLRGGV
jgi:hypothetical protein